MRPRWKTGDLVSVAIPHSSVSSDVVRAMIICVQQSNNVPDAEVRGLKDLQPWSYWVLTLAPLEHYRWHCKIAGPLRQDQVRECTT